MSDFIKPDNVIADKNTVAWESDAPIWQGYSGNPDCSLCKKEPGTIYRKGHARWNGLIVEDSKMYCNNCDENRRDECDADFKVWWEAKRARAEQVGEENWQKHGIYTNVGGSGPGGLSTHFGYVKLDDGTFKPYRFVHPQNETDEFDARFEEEHNRIESLSLNDLEKFAMLREFLVNYQTEHSHIDRQRWSQIKRLDEYVAENERKESNPPSV